MIPLYRAGDGASEHSFGIRSWRPFNGGRSTYSRAFGALAEGCLAERVHEALIQEHFGEELIGYISRDGTAIEAHAPRPSAAIAVSRTSSAAKTSWQGRHQGDESHDGILALSADQLMRLRHDHVPIAPQLQHARVRGRSRKIPEAMLFL